MSQHIYCGEGLRDLWRASGLQNVLESQNIGLKLGVGEMSQLQDS